MSGGLCLVVGMCVEKKLSLMLNGKTVWNTARTGWDAYSRMFQR